MWVAPSVGALPFLAVAGVLLLVCALALGLMAAVPGTIVLLGSEFMLSLAARHTEAGLTAAVIGAALLLLAELAFLSIQLRTPSRAEPGFFRRQALMTAIMTLSALAISLLAAILSMAPVAGSLPLLAAGVSAIVVMIGLVAAFSWRTDAG